MLEEHTELDNGTLSNRSINVTKDSLNELQNALSQAIELYKKKGGKASTIKFYDQSGGFRRVNTKKKITTIKKRRFIPYGMQEQDLPERSARVNKNRKGKRSKNGKDDDGYDYDQYTQSSGPGEYNQNSIKKEQNISNEDLMFEEEEEEYEENEIQQNKYRPRTLREKMDAVEALLHKMEGDLNNENDYTFSDEFE